MVQENHNNKSILIKRAATLFITAGLVSLIGCASTKTIMVDVPPKFDLKAFKTIGVVEFVASAEHNVGKQITQKFVQTIQTAQPGIIVVELGSKDKVLKDLGATEFDANAIRAMKDKFGIEVVFYGELAIEEPKVKVSFSSMNPASFKAQRNVKGNLTSKLWHTGSGGVAWTNATEGEYTLQQGTATSFGMAADQEEVYRDLVNSLVFNLTPDFRSTKRSETVPK